MSSPDRPSQNCPHSINMNGAALEARGDKTFGSASGLTANERVKRGLEAMRLGGYELDPTSPLASDDDTYPFRLATEGPA